MASNPQPQGGGFDLNKLFRPPSPGPAGGGNLATSPSFPAQSSTPPPPFLTPSSSYPPPTGPYPFHYIPYPPAPVRPGPPPSPSSGSDLHWAFFSNLTQNPNSNQNQSPSAPPVRLLSSKVPKGRHLVGDGLVYDIDVRLPGEMQPQLEVTPITKYASDPGLVLGRQIAVNRNYICYGLKLGNIRILNINTALRSLLRGHTQRVTDMAFFAEDVHLLASASVDGRIFVWKINEGPDEEDKPQIFGKVVIALQILGHGLSVHPRVCWHPHKQEILMFALGNRILKIDTIKIGKMDGFSVEEPLNCPIDKLIDGIQFVGKHDGEITELSMCQWLTTRLASASVDGTVKIWEDRKPVPLAVLRPHNGYPVNSATFLTAPHRPDHIILFTGGPLNRELKIWVSASEEGWLLPSDAESWQCTQTLELKSSAESRIEDAFFNQVVALPHSGLVLLANAKKNAIYALHIDYGPNPATTRMDYIAEFTVTMPILSLTGTSESLPDGEHTVQVYCVQTQAIQQYALDLSQCLPPPLDNLELEKTDSGPVFDVTNADDSVTPGLPNTSKPNELPFVNSTSSTSGLSVGAEVPSMTVRTERSPSSEVTALSEIITSGMENKPSAVPLHTNAEHIYAASPTVPLSPKLAQKSSGFKSPPNTDQISDQSTHDYSGDHGLNVDGENKSDITHSVDNLQNNDKIIAQNDISVVPDPPLVFKHPTHLVTPSEILSTSASTSETVQTSHGGEPKVQNMVGSNGAENGEVEVKVVEEAGFAQTSETECTREPHVIVAEKKEKAFYSQASDLGLQMASDFRREAYGREGAQQVNDASVAGLSRKLSNDGEGERQDMMPNAPPNNINSDILVTVSQSPSTATKGRKQKGKHSQLPCSPSPSQYNSTDSSNEPACSSGGQLCDAAFPQLQPMQDMLEQLMSMQKEMQKQMSAILSGPVNKEGKRLEASLGRNLEKVVKAHNDALWARFLEENAKHEKLERDLTQQITNLITNCMNKDLPAVFEKVLKKEIAAIGPVVARAITPNLEKSISAAILESFQKGVGDKAVNQLEKSVGSKLEATVARQIQSQFQTSGKQALQEALRTSLETSVIPAFEMSCKTMFEQIETTFQKGLVKHTAVAQQQSDNAHSSLAVALREAINSATSITQTLSGELAEGQRKILAIAAAGANSKDGNTLVKHLSNGPMAGLHDIQPEPHLDPMKELSRLIAERKYEEAFTAALHRSDVSIVSWLCSQVDLRAILSTAPVPLTQGVLLALLQQLACDMSNETSKKVLWMTDVAVAINPADPVIAMHVRPIFDQVYQIVGHHRSLPNASASEASNLRVLMHVINSVLRSCK